jgi:uncharacterized membrane protein
MRSKKISTWLLTIFFVSVGVLHFTHTGAFLKAMPPYVPMPVEMVYLSGVFEILGGIGVQVPLVRKSAGYGLILLLAAVYPANIHMALHTEDFSSIPPAVLWIRLLFQPLLMWWVWSCAIRPRK